MVSHKEINPILNYFLLLVFDISMQSKNGVTYKFILFKIWADGEKVWANEIHVSFA